MSDHDQLRDLLERTAPDHPELDPGSRATSVVRRGRAARNRSRALVAGAAVAVLAGIVVPLSLDGGDGSGVANDPPAPTAPPCPAGPVDVTEPAAVPVLDDVVAVRSCPATWSGAAPDAGPGPGTLPTAPLLGGAAASFADAVSALPAYVLPSDCAVMSVMPDPWALMVTTGDDETFVLGSTMRVCGAVSIGGTDRGAEDVLAAFAPSR